VGGRIKQARCLAKIAARELDRLAGITEGHTSLIESGHVADATSQTLVKIARVLGVSLDWLVSGFGDGPTTDTVIAAVAVARNPAPASGALPDAEDAEEPSDAA
jgi:transcriptional regulator with XRE-family HTH domain